MKIALCVPSSWPSAGASSGIMTYASRLVPALRRLGHEVFVLTPRKDDNDFYTIDLRDFSSTPKLWNRAMFRLAPEHARFKAVSSAISSAVKELVNSNGLDIFEIEESFGFSFAISKLRLVPVVVRLHGPWFLTGKFEDLNEKNDLHPHRQKWEGRAISHAEFVTAPSSEVLQSVKDHYRLKLTDSQVVANPLEAVTKEHVWDISSCDARNLLFVGRFDRLKGGDLVLHAFANLVTAFPSLKLTFVGPDVGLMRKNEGNKQFDQYVRDCFPEVIRSRIEFLGQLDHSHVMSLRSKHFATIVASQYEVFGYSVLEAMSFGCPVVATDVGGVPELIKDEYNGLLVPSQNVEAMVEACRRLLNDHTLAVRLGRQAWQDCTELYGPTNIAEKTVAAYRRAIDLFRCRAP
jgi:glycosyltransferase involved in cell wall biosynthesis